MSVTEITASFTSIEPISGEDLDNYLSLIGLSQAEAEALANETILATICFAPGTLVATDSGNVAVEKLSLERHTIRGRSRFGIINSQENNRESLRPNLG